MTHTSTPNRAAQDTAPDRTPDDARYRDVLNTLIDQAAALATRIATTAMAATTPDSALPEATVAFERIARTVRRTIGLAQHIAHGIAHPPVATAQPGTTRTTARAKLIRGVEDAIYRKRRETDTESLTSEFHERLEDPMLELDLEGRTVEDLIEEISRDLGVAQASRSYVWPRRTPEDLKILQARAATHPSPLNTRHCEALAGAAAIHDSGTEAAVPSAPHLHLATTAMHAPIQARPPKIQDG